MGEEIGKAIQNEAPEKRKESVRGFIVRNFGVLCNLPKERMREASFLLKKVYDCCSIE